MTEQLVLCRVVHLKSEPAIRSLRDRNRLYWRAKNGEYIRILSVVPVHAIRRVKNERRLWLRTDCIY